MCPDHHSRSVTGVEPNRGCRLSWINTSAAEFDDETSVRIQFQPSEVHFLKVAQIDYARAYW